MLTWGNKSSLQLAVTAAADSANPITVRGLTRSGVIDLQFDTLATGGVVTKTIGIDDLPILLSAIDQGNSFNQNECWVSVQLYIDGEESIHLCSGFVYGNKGITYPAITSGDTVPNKGLLVNVNSADPAAAAEISMTVPVGEIWLVKYGSVALVTDANVVNRRPVFVFTNSSGGVVTCANPNLQAESTTKVYTLTVGGAYPVTSANDYLPCNLPHELWLDPGSTIVSVTTTIQAADNYGIMHLFVEKFFGRA